MLGLCLGMYREAFTDTNGLRLISVYPYISREYLSRLKETPNGPESFPAHRLYYRRLDRCPLRMS